MKNKPALAGLPFSDLSELLNAYPIFRSRQIYKWICQGTDTFNDMSNLPVSLRKELDEIFSLLSGITKSALADTDGTVKLGITLEDNSIIEAVMLNDGKGRKTACLSTQAGCPIGCIFCKTGSLGFRRNLSSAEIASQFLLLRKREPAISHIVIMGMGEPLLNLAELRKSIVFFTEKAGLNISSRRITVSTSGIIKGIKELADDGPAVRLALSLNSARQDLREKLMPVALENPLEPLKKALLHYQEKQNQRITLEMVLLGGVNTGLYDAEALADFTRGLHAVINIIPWNPVEGMKFEGSPLRPPTAREKKDFSSFLERLGLKHTFRIGKGLGISGACGQLGVVER